MIQIKRFDGEKKDVFREFGGLGGARFTLLGRGNARPEHEPVRKFISLGKSVAGGAKGYWILRIAQC